MEAPVLVFPFGYLSHYLRCIVLARVFRPFHEITFLAHPDYNCFVRREGFDTFACENWDSAAILPLLRRMNFSWLNDPAIERIFRAQVSAIQRFRAFLVIGDNQPTLRMAAEATSVTYLSVQNGYLSKYYAATRPMSRRHPLYPLLSRLPAPLRNPLTRAGEALTFRQIQRHFNRVRRRYGLPKRRSYLEEIEGDMTLLCDPPGLFPHRVLPRNYFEIGPLIYDRSQEPLPVLPHFDPAKRTIFVCMGSTGDWSAVQFLNDPWFRRYNIITAGDRENVLAPARLANYDFLAASHILQQVDLGVCHGGNGIINQCLRYGVPVLCRTTHFEQEWNAAAVERIGMGRSLDGINRIDALQKVFTEWITRKECLIQKCCLQ